MTRDARSRAHGPGAAERRDSQTLPQPPTVGGAVVGAAGRSAARRGECSAATPTGAARGDMSYTARTVRPDPGVRGSGRAGGDCGLAGASLTPMGDRLAATFSCFRV